MYNSNCVCGSSVIDLCGKSAKETIHQSAAPDDEIKTRRRGLAATSQPLRRNPTLAADQGARGR